MNRHVFSRRALLGGATIAGLAAGRMSFAQSLPAKAFRHPLLETQHAGIIKSRDAALAVLKPTPAQLEHGLALHAGSLVFDSYGFAPRAGVDVEQIQAAMTAGAPDAVLDELRETMTMTRAALVDEEREEFREAMRCSGVTCIFQNAGEEGHDPLRLMRRLAHFTYLGDMFRDTLIRATLPDDIVRARAEGKHCLYLTGNGVPLPERWNTVAEELSYIRTFFELGIRMMHVTYNRRNMLGDGCAESANGGLSDLGRAAVAEMNKVGVIVDVAHSGQKTSFEAAKASSRPMVASHTVCAAINGHIRAKTDEVIRAICDTGGLVGVCCIPNFLGRGGDIAALLDHIDYVAKKFGVDHVAIGTDVAHTSQFSKSVPGKPGRKRAPRFASLWPPGSMDSGPMGRETIAWTNWPLFTVGLAMRGYKDEEIQKILGGNMLRVCRDALKA
ncbi:Membrane dipeptidase (Peptidase family M19) [Caulifigura coniformis]|uniref:Membrane dipeptidase (Peptidase family M19) n=1 Tax=Caulifigura coniformis TaxID=2527983 RepID=A0A517S8B4_9PLAN|nr:membrane dipeptidase [Caulifigura coniformis]QDT52359.1 Membrane dipeptidase (Peptidase family M19) [Caulifigura coniformis]